MSKFSYSFTFIFPCDSKREKQNKLSSKHKKQNKKKLKQNKKQEKHNEKKEKKRCRHCKEMSDERTGDIG